MKRIHGSVFLRETNTGIPNLVVAAFDSESRNGVNRLLDNRSLAKLEIEQLGKRIGSVLTDNMGQFVLTHEDLKFEGVESRPDLIIAVFAPEDVTDPKNPFPLSPKERLLYLSMAPRSDAGSEEAYIIRLLQIQLEKYGIPTLLTQENEPASSRYFAQLEKSYLFQENLNAMVSKRAQDQQKAANESRKKAKDKLKGFVTPPPTRAGDHYLEDPKDSAGLKKIQHTVIKDGLSNLGTMKKAATLRLNNKQMAEFGLKVQGKKIQGRINSSDFADSVKKLTGGVDLVLKKENVQVNLAKTLLSKYSMEFINDQKKTLTMMVPVAKPKAKDTAQPKPKVKTNSGELVKNKSSKQVKTQPKTNRNGK